MAPKIIKESRSFLNQLKNCVCTMLTFRILEVQKIVPPHKSLGNSNNSDTDHSKIFRDYQTRSTMAHLLERKEKEELMLQ